MSQDELGAPEVLDFAWVLSAVDMTLNTVGGGDYGPRSIPVMRQGGLLVSLAVAELPSGVHDLARETGVRSDVMLVESDRAALWGISDLVKTGQLHVEIDSVFSLSEVAAAHRRGEEGKTSRGDRPARDRSA